MMNQVVAVSKALSIDGMMRCGYGGCQAPEKPREWFLPGSVKNQAEKRPFVGRKSYHALPSLAGSCQHSRRL